jgi:hypothetical protein
MFVPTLGAPAVAALQTGREISRIEWPDSGKTEIAAFSASFTLAGRTAVTRKFRQLY